MSDYFTNYHTSVGRLALLYLKRDELRQRDTPLVHLLALVSQTTGSFTRHNSKIGAPWNVEIRSAKPPQRFCCSAGGDSGQARGVRSALWLSRITQLTVSLQVCCFGFR